MWAASVTQRDALADRQDPKITAQAISKYEAEKMSSSSRVLVGMGRELGVSLDFLMGGQVETLESVEWRKHSKSSAQDRAKAEAVVIERLESYLSIEDILALEPEADPFGSLRIAEVEDESAVDGLAQAVRNEWKLGIDPIPSITFILEDRGLRVVEADLPERINGLACRVERTSRPPTEVIVASKRTSVERKRLNLVHELVHRIISATGNPALRPEQATNRFVGAFLVPREHLVAREGRDRNRMTWHEIMELKRTYGVSAAVMLVRLGEVGVLSKATVEYAFKTYARSWRKEEPEPIAEGEGFATFEKPKCFERLVWRALGEELISPVRAAQMLRMPLGTVEREIRGPRDSRPALSSMMRTA